MNNRSPYLVIFHHPCDDGFGASCALRPHLPADTEYLGLQYNDPAWAETVTPKIAEYVRSRMVYIVDFSFPKVVMETIIASAAHVVWLDHHKSAFETWCETEREFYAFKDEKATILLDNNRSGARITWDWAQQSFLGDMSNPPLPKLIAHIDDNDRWQHQLEGTREIIRALRSYPMDPTVWAQLINDDKLVYSLKAEGVAIERYFQQQLKQAMHDAVQEIRLPMPDGTLHGLACNLPAMFSSEAGHIMAEQSGTFGITYRLDGSDTIKVSIRGCGVVDVSHVARNFGGGGHKNAAGFKVTTLRFLSWLSPTPTA